MCTKNKTILGKKEWKTEENDWIKENDGFFGKLDLGWFRNFNGIVFNFSTSI